MFKKATKSYNCSPKIVERLVFYTMSGMTLTGKKPWNMPFEQAEAKAYMYMDIKSFLQDARCQNVDGFFAAISPEIKQLQIALLALSKKVRDESIMFLDANGNSIPTFTSNDNPSSDAD